MSVSEKKSLINLKKINLYKKIETKDKVDINILLNRVRLEKKHDRLKQFRIVGLVLFLVSILFVVTL
tara:strand:- start:220 stop:420 length:201 start_codon:yes stop_codon:yes gene_type:complete